MILNIVSCWSPPGAYCSRIRLGRYLLQEKGGIYPCFYDMLDAPLTRLSEGKHFNPLRSANQEHQLLSASVHPAFMPAGRERVAKDMTLNFRNRFSPWGQNIIQLASSLVFF